MGIASKAFRWVKLWKNQFLSKELENKRCDDHNAVLVIKLDAIGDFIIWLDSAKEYRGLFPGKKTVLLCNSACEEIAAATNYFDHIQALDIRKFEENEEYRKEQLALFATQKYGTIIQTAYSRTQHMDMLAAGIPARVKIAFAADESKSNVSRRVLLKRNRRVLDEIYDRLIPSTNETIMELQRNKEFIRGLGNKDFKSSIPQLPHVNGVQTPDRPYFLVFPGASTQIKRWRTDNFAVVIDHVFAKTDWECIVCGGKEETDVCEEIRERVRQKDRLVNYCGKTSLTELIEVVRQSKFVLSNDTSGIHYAAATGVIGICPFGEYNYGRFLPYRSDERKGTIRVCSAHMKCRNCASKHMTLTCIMHILKTGRYLCLDRVEAESINNLIDKEVLRKENGR